MRSRPFGASATTNVPFGATANAVGSMMRPASPPIWTISHELVCCFVDAEDGVRAAIEDEVLAGGGLLKAGRLAETCRRCAAGTAPDRVEDVGLERRERRRIRRQTRERASESQTVADRVM